MTSQSEAPESAARRTILLVDDTPSVLALYGHTLEKLGHRVLAASDGLAALAFLETHVPDLVILDRSMPHMSGDDLLCIIRKRKQLDDVPVIFLTAAGDDDDSVNEAFNLGVNDYITKPVNYRLLGARVGALLAERRSRHSRDSFKVHARLLADVAKARDLQRSQLPKVPILCGSWRVNGVLHPCDAVGGDMFDVLQEQGTTFVVLLDVSGHGLTAGMSSSAVRALLRLLLRSEPFEGVLSELNRQLADLADGSYACVAIASLCGDVVKIANAGLPPVAIVSSGNIVAEVVGSGIPPGLLPHSEYRHEVFELKRGDRIVLSSDGLTEPFGRPDHIATYFEALRLVAADPVQHAVLDDGVSALLKSTGVAQHDDAAIVVVEHSG